ncbi:hypothetical protein RclHR1_14260003 [Rhizophagus clarus]|uniref:Kinase-like domain-containing protein n=1 Tax=Rhizophagus clarus TaxID=94130 RepID=A0A2Z6QGI5_9GLOM|nr:hypothetical protein RclHR1_14260003 [Rhizophagus clarus]GET01176.1 kinase-like domain-containing protein [Rhizophagus clarus]
MQLVQQTFAGVSLPILRKNVSVKRLLVFEQSFQNYKFKNVWNTNDKIIRILNVRQDPSSKDHLLRKGRKSKGLLCTKAFKHFFFLFI